jgi:hypothetical protein
LPSTAWRRWSTSSELDGLPQRLDQGETAVAALEASRGLRWGVLVLTDRRLLFLYLDDLREALALADIGAVELRAATWHGGESLVVELGAEQRVFTDLAPKERVTEFVTALRDRVVS